MAFTVFDLKKGLYLMRKNLIASHSVRSIRQGLAVFLLFTSMAYTVLPANSNASNSASKTNGPAVENKAPLKKREEIWQEG